MQVATAVDELEEVVERYPEALDVFVQGKPEPLKALFSRADDVVLANPFGPAVRGWDNADATLDYACSRFSNGDASGFDRMATYVAGDLAIIFEVENGTVSVGGGTVSDWVLRTTTTKSFSRPLNAAPISAATRVNASRLGRPLRLSGVPTQIKAMSVCAIASTADVVADNFPARTT